MNKSEILDLVREALGEELASRLEVAKRTREFGNDPESQAKSKYETLSTEENYLADGLSKMAAESAQALEILQAMPLREFQANDPIAPGALVEIEFPDAREWFFLAEAGGGTEVRYKKGTITVITPSSPLGARLLGARAGDQLTAPAAKIRKVL
jgi:hypothetical protein